MGAWQEAARGERVLLHRALRRPGRPPAGSGLYCTERFAVGAWSG